MMWVNNEVGSIMPVEAIRSCVRRSGAPALIRVSAGLENAGDLIAVLEQAMTDL